MLKYRENFIGIVKRTNLMSHWKNQLPPPPHEQSIQFLPPIKIFLCEISNDGMMAFISNKWQAIIKFNVTENR